MHVLLCGSWLQRRRSLLADMNVVLGCGTNTTMPVAAEIAQEVGESVEFKSEVVQSATLNNVTVDEIGKLVKRSLCISVLRYSVL